MLPGQRCDGEANVALVERLRLPGLQGVDAGKALFAQLPRGVGLGHDGQCLVQTAGGALVEVVAVVMRQHDEVERREIRFVTRRLRAPPRPQTHTEIRAPPYGGSWDQ